MEYCAGVAIPLATLRSPRLLVVSRFLILAITLVSREVTRLEEAVVMAVYYWHESADTTKMKGNWSALRSSAGLPDWM